MKGDRAPLRVRSHGMTGSEGAAADRGVVVGGVEEARGNLQSLRGKVHRWEAKRGRCPGLGDVLGGIAAGEKVLEGKRRLREAHRAVEDLQGKLASKGTGDDGVKVEEGGDDNVHVVGVEGHPEGNPVVAQEAKGGGSEYDEGDETTLLHVTKWMRKRLGSSGGRSCHLPPDKGDGGSQPPPPSLDACILKSSTHHLHLSVVVATLPLEAVAHQGQDPLPGAWRMGMHHVGPR